MSHFMATPKALLKEIDSDRFKPAYYFYGAEDYRIVEATKYLVHKYLPDRQRITSYRRLDGGSCPARDLIAELSAIPMLGDKLIITVSNVQSYKPKELANILKMLQPPDPSRVVVFSSPSHKAPKKGSAIFKAMQKAEVELVEFAKLSRNEVMSQITGALKRGKLSIEPEALNLLTDMVAGNRGGLDTEVSKLVNFLEPEATVTSDDVRRVCSGYEVYNVFELADRLVEGRTDFVLKMLRTLIADGNHPILISTLLQQHFVSLYLVKNGKQPLGRRGWMLPRFKSQASRFSEPALEQILIDLAVADADLRRSPLSDEQVLEQLAIETCKKLG